MKTTQLSTNFTAGEVSPRLLGRTDLKKYGNGVGTLENFLIQVHGGVERRPGTRFVAEANLGTSVVAANPPRLVEFQFNVEQSYCLEFGVVAAGAGDTGYIRFFRLDAGGTPVLLVDDGTTNPTILPSLPFRDTELAGLQFAQSADVLYIFSSTRAPHVLKRVGTDDDDADSWTYSPMEYNDGPYLPINTDETLTLTASSTDAASNPIVVGASAPTFVTTDVGRIIRFEDDSTGYDIIGFDAGTWSSGSGGSWTTPASIVVDDDLAMVEHGGDDVGTGIRIEFLKVTKGVPELNDTVYVGRNFIDNGSGKTKFYLYHPTTGEAVGFSYLTGDENPNAGDLNGLARFERASHVGWGRIKTFVSATSVTFDIVDELPSDRPTTNFRLGAWSEATGYPSTGRFYQDRLWTASSTAEPQTIWSTGTGTYNCYSPTTVKEGLVLDTSAITVTLADAQVNEIKYLAGDTSGLIILTSGGEWLGRASTAQTAITPTDLGFQKSSTYGSASGLIPVHAGTSLLFVQRDTKVVRELTYQFGEDRFVAPNVTLLSEHITGGGVIDSAYQQGKTTRIWYVREDGQLLTLTFEKTEEVMGWHRQKLAQSSFGQDAVVSSIASTIDNATDNVWIMVKRIVGGEDHYYIEMFEQPLDATSEHNTAFYLDSGLTGYDASGSQTWSGLTHLAGQSVYVLGDGVSFSGSEGAGYLVDGSGAIDLGVGKAPRYVTIGLKYDSVMESLPLSPPASKQGEPRGSLKRVYKNFINLYRTLGGSVGTPDQVYPIEYPTATSLVLNTGMFEVSTPDNASRESIIRYEQSDSQPATILSIVSEFNVGGN